MARILLVGACLALSQQATALPASCDVVSIGAGWAGVYTAFRRTLLGSKVCIFEASHRVGGRTYSHKLVAGKKKEPFTLDVGAYRFSPDMHLPGDVILKVLGLPTACYEPDCPAASKDFPAPFHFNYTAPLRRIVDAEGMPAGYVTAIDGMLKIIMAAGGELFLGANLTDVQPQANGTQLVFGNEKVHAKEVMLNLPRTPFLSLPSLRAATPNRTLSMAKCVKFDLPTSFFPAGSFQLGKSLSKAYAFYDDAWWISKLNQSAGQLPENAFMPVNTSEHIPVGIHFNDGPLRCDAERSNCRGFLEVYYSTVNDEDFFESLRPSTFEPLGTLTPEKDSTGKLPRLHAAVMEATKPLFEKKNATQPKDPPSLLVVGVWDRTGSGYTAPTKVYYSALPSTPGGSDPLEKACGVAGLTEKEYRDSIMFPVPGRTDISLANNDWVAQTTETMFGDWAEESLLQAERALRVKGFARPKWLDQDYYNRKVAGVTDHLMSLVV